MSTNAIVATDEVRAVLVAATRPLRVREVAEELSVSQPTTRRHLDLLVGRGWAVRERRRPYGRRLVAFYALTGEGRQAENEGRGF